MYICIMQLHIHIHNHFKNEELILHKLDNMANELAEIKAKLIEADAKVDKVSADVTRLHELIAGTGDEGPTPEEWEEVKLLATSLNDKLQAVDDSTPE